MSYHCPFLKEKFKNKIYSPVQDKEELKIWYNQALYQLYQSSDIIRTIKAARLGWAGHL
jgi:hypothetical protein